MSQIRSKKGRVLFLLQRRRLKAFAAINGQMFPANVVFKSAATVTVMVVNKLETNCE